MHPSLKIYTARSFHTPAGRFINQSLIQICIGSFSKVYCIHDSREAKLFGEVFVFKIKFPVRNYCGVMLVGDFQCNSFLYNKNEREKRKVFSALLRSIVQFS